MSVQVEIPATLPEGKIADFIDGKIRNDSPEEYVRQNIERRLVRELEYKPEQVAVEFTIKLGSSKKRVDLAIFDEGDKHTQENIRIIVECKKDSTEPSNKKEGVEQLKTYLAACTNAEWGMWTNGRAKAVFRKRKAANGRIVYDEPNDIPPVSGETEEIDRPLRENLNRATDDNLLFSFKICHNHIYITDGLQKQPAFFELLKVIFCKISDERNVPKPLEFYATTKEKSSNDGRLTIKNRLNSIFTNVKKRYPTIFPKADSINLNPRSLAYIVGELQRYSFLDTHIDVKGKAYEELVGANLRGDRGEFFTPRNVQRMAIEMLDLKHEEKIIDPSCGTGGFLVIAMNRVIDELRKEFGDDKGTVYQEALNDRIREIAQQSFFGFDINPDLVKATKMNMVMNNDGSGNILRQDSLLHPHQWDSSFKKELGIALGSKEEPILFRSPEDLAQFDVIATNPPFGSKLPVKDAETLEQFSLGHVWDKDDEGNWVKTDNLASSAPPEILFIERCYQLLKPGGRMAIVLPDAILGAPGLGYVRQWILETCRLIASIDLHPDTFQPRNGTQTSVLLLQRKTEKELQNEAKQRKQTDYEIYMAEIRAIGHDKRGNTIFRRNDHGEEILFPPIEEEIALIEHKADGKPSVRPKPREKQVDDESPLVAKEFLSWKKSAYLTW